MKRIFSLTFFLALTTLILAQDTQYSIALVGFYNFENLFDTLDTPDVRDTEFSPAGEKRYGTKIYQDKLGRLAQVVSEVGTDLSPDGLAILGVSEIENRSVLEDFVKEDRIKDRNYQIVHYDSPDKRGIDVALIYQPKYFTVTGSKAHPLLLYDEAGERVYTRDVLYVSGELDGDPIHLLVNHWPSRSGGENASQWRRNGAAMLCKTIIDSLTQIDKNAKIILMGDLNDDPTSPSVRKVLNAKGNVDAVKTAGLYNPMQEKFKKGFGTTAWRDAWSLFDQMVVSAGLLDKNQKGYFFYSANIFKERYMLQRTGQYKGYPKRAFVGDNYMEGYSDHFPVYSVFLKEIN
ncbi:MAG: endonuclease [Phaeodactylibacter sp.]|nr:endonuclease [Phaeodactylibacter sp.]